MTRRRLGGCVALVAAVLASGCCVRPPLAALPRVRGAPASEARVAAVLAALEAQQASVHTLKIIHTITLVSQGGASSGALRGLLAVRRPDAYRLRVLGPAGLTAMDLSYRAGRFVLDVPSGDVHVVGDATTPRERLHGVPVDGLARAFLGTFDAARASLVEGARRSVLTLYEPGGVRRELFLRRAPRDADIQVEIDARFEHGRETLRLTHSDLRRVSGVQLPYRVRCDMPDQGLSATISVDRYDVNPDLPEALFAPLPAQNPL